MINFFTGLASTGRVYAPPATPPEYNNEQVLLTETSFSGSSFPAGWSNIGGFTQNNGLEMSGIGGIGSYTHNINRTYIDRVILKGEFILNDVNSKVGIGKRESLRGNLAKIDFENNLIHSGIMVATNAEPTYAWSTPLSITKTVGNTYVVEYSKDRNVIKCKVYDKSNPLLFDQLIIDYDIDNSFAGSFWGTFAFYFFEGDVKLIYLGMHAISPQSPKVGMYGDSITEGYTVIPYTKSLKNRWSDKVWEANSGNAYISAHGGYKTDNTLGYIDFEQLYISPQYTIMLLGTNNSVYSTWLTDIQSLISKILAIGSTPVLCTIPPRGGKQDFINSANAWIMSQAVYDYIDFAAAVTIGRDRLTWVSSYLMDDNVHPSVDGHQAMYDEIATNNSHLIN